MNYKLIKIKPTGMRVTLAEDLDVSEMVTTGLELQHKHPDMQFGIIDCDGMIVWPERKAS